MSPNVFAVAGIGLLLGLRHAFEPDHLAAVSTLATRPSPRLWSAARLGLVWGLGHTATVGIVVTAAMLALCGPAGARPSLPDKLERSAHAGDAQAPPENDYYAEPLDINDVAIGSNLEATEDPGEDLTWRDPSYRGCSDDGLASSSGWPRGS